LSRHTSDPNDKSDFNCHNMDGASSAYNPSEMSDFSTSVAHTGSIVDHHLSTKNDIDSIMGMKSLTPAEHAETLKIMEGLEADISSGDYIRFLNDLDHRGTGGTTTTWEMEEKVILESFRSMRYHVMKGQNSNPNVVLLTGEGWVKTIKSKFSAFENSKVVAVSCLLTFLTLSSLPGNYPNLIVRRGGVHCVMKTLVEHRRDKETCTLACALILSLSLNEKEGLNATYEQVDSIVKRLVSLISSGGYGTDIALRALFQFTRHKKRLLDSGKTLSHLVKTSFREEERSVVALFRFIEESDARESSIEAAMSLLWRLSVPKDEFDNDDLFLTTNHAMMTIISSMDLFDSIAIREAGCGTLANMFIRKSFPTELSQQAVSSIYGFILRTESIDEGLATCALHAICNMLEKSIVGTSLLFDERLMEALVFLMKQYPESEELIEFACLIIGRAARHNQEIKESLMTSGAFELVRGAFEEFVISRGDNPSLDVKDASLCAFATLTGCLSGARAAISTGLVEIFDTLLAVETDRDFAVVLNIIITNAKSYASNDGFSTSLEDTLRQQPQMFSELMENTSSDTSATSLISVIVGADQAYLESAFNSDEGLRSFFSAMTRYSNSANVQESGCALIAEIYFHLPYPLNDVDTLQGPWAPLSQREALTIIHRAMKTHFDNVNIQINGCLAILNLLHPVSEPGGNSLDRQAISLVIELSYTAILDCLRIHEPDVNLQRNGLSALAVSISVAQTEDFEPWATRIVEHLSSIILQFTGNHSIQTLALDAMIIVQEVHPSMKCDHSSSGISALLNLVGSDNSEIAGQSSTVISSLLRNNPELSNQIMECRGTVERLLTTLRTKREELQIQVNIYSILHDVIIFSEDCAVAITQLLDQHNGIHILCMGINSHPHNRTIAITLFKILSSIVRYLDKDSLARSRDAIELYLTEGLESHLENSDVVSVILDVLCTCCDRDDHFKKRLLEEARARMIMNTIHLNLGSVDAQSSGCNLLSMLSNFGGGKETIGKYGGISAIVNALLTHNDSTVVQRKGLVALKNLATAPTNKSMINDVGGESSVIYALWIHYRDPELVSIGLSALNNIAVDPVTRSVAKMNDQVLIILVAAMRNFPMDERVQKNACFYLKTCSYLPENVRMMCEQSEDLLPLLLQAGESFPEQCRNRANAVVTKITSN